LLDLLNASPAIQDKAPAGSAGAFLICFYWEPDMWKLLVGFIIFAALALYMLSRGGDIDLGGEKHGGLTPSSSAVGVDNAG
jgi:hypothetical protein